MVAKESVVFGRNTPALGGGGGGAENADGGGDGAGNWCACCDGGGGSGTDPAHENALFSEILTGFIHKKPICNCIELGLHIRSPS